ncbi:MAG: type I methionyl aminopeptidase [Myxococcota bacterium]
MSRPRPNEPCWCGSGAKYKKCHREEDERAHRPAPVVRVRPGRVSPRRTVPATIPRPDYAESGVPGLGFLQEPSSRLPRMRRACRAAAEILRELGQKIAPGVTTDELDELCHQAYIARGGFPSTLNYRGFPKSLCTSVNEVVLHGIPDSRPLEKGDIVNLDVTIYLDGMHGDCSATFAVGAVDADSQRLMRVTQECLQLGIEAVKPGRPLRAIGAAIEAHAKKTGMGVVREFCGHGIGEVFHADPQICHYDDPDATQPMEEGMLFTIEPMITLGSPELQLWDDGWTVVTADGRRSAQYEHTVLVTREGAELLTRLE